MLSCGWFCFSEKGSSGFGDCGWNPKKNNESSKKEMKGVLSALCCMFESVDEIIINLSFSVVTLLCTFGTSLFCQVGTKESNKVKLNGREKTHIHLGILLTVLTCKHFNCKQSQF